MTDLVERLRAEVALYGARTTDSVLMDEAADEIIRLRTERESMRADALRYRWLRDDSPWAMIGSNGATRFAVRLPVDLGPGHEGHELDAAIDAAMGAKP